MFSASTHIRLWKRYTICQKHKACNCCTSCSDTTIRMSQLSSYSDLFQTFIKHQSPHAALRSHSLIYKAHTRLLTYPPDYSGFRELCSKRIFIKLQLLRIFSPRPPLLVVLRSNIGNHNMVQSWLSLWCNWQ